MPISVTFTGNSVEEIRALAIDYFEPATPPVTPPVVVEPPPVQPPTPPIVEPPTPPVVVERPPVPPSTNIIWAGSSGVVLKAGPGQQYTTVQAAINAAKDGDTIKVMPGTPRETLQFTKSLLIDGQDAKGDIGVVWNFTGFSSSGLARQKGAIVPLTPKHWIIQGFSFTGVGMDRVAADLTCAIRPDMNTTNDMSTGIIRNCKFSRNQCGVGCGVFDLDLTIDNCIFDNNGIDNLSHNVYVGKIRAVTLINVVSLMSDPAKGVHAVKSRAKTTSIRGGRYSAVRGAVINIPAGGTYNLWNTQIDKPISDNHIVVQYASENQDQGLSENSTITSSTFNLLCNNPTFDLRGGTVSLKANTFTGNKPSMVGAGQVIWV